MDKEHVRILLIEDDEDDYALVRELLSEIKLADYSLEWVKTYQEGLKGLCRGEHDVYLLDYRLGSRSGLELMGEATGSGCDKPIILLTGQGDHEVDMGAMRSGAADYLVKAQLTNDMLERSIRYSIARKEVEQKLKSYRNHLEDLVRERTEQLETANEKLRVEIAERKQAEKALQESAGELRGLFAAMTDVVLVLDANGRYVKIAPTNPANLYRPSDELLGKYVHEVLSEEDTDKIVQQIKRALENHETINFEYPLKIGSEEAWFDGKVSPLTEDTVFWIAHDITERKREQDELFNSRQMLRSVLDNIPQRVFWKDRNSVYLGCNKSLAKDCGFKDPTELVGKTDYETASAATADLYRTDDREVMETGKAKLRFEEPQIKPDGSEAWLITSKVPMYDNSGQVIGVLGTYEDITERKRMEEVLRESQSLLSTVIESIPFEFWAIGQDGRYMLVNSVCVNHYGNILGKKPEDICDDPETLSIWQENNRNAFAGKLVKGDVKSCFGGIERFSHNIITAIRDGDQVRGILGVNIDISERLQAQEDLCKSRDELELRVKERTAALEKANEELRQIPSKLIAVQEEERRRLASELHDSIGQTLAAVKFWIEMALKFRDEGNDNDVLNHLERFVPTLQRSIEETRNIYMGLRPPMLEDMGLLAALEWLRRESMKFFPERHVEFEAVIAEEEIPENLKVNIFRIVQEALNNVAKHSKAEWVDISLVKNRNAIELVVSDDGVGMDLDQILQTSTARSLGFTSMRERAEIFEGGFSIESTPGEGTAIRVCWPIAAEE
jgi:PAS domain S-box-containing protein